MTTKNVLVIEDDPDILNLIVWHMENEGYSVKKSQNGKEGLEMAFKQMPDLIVLDLMLPGTDGFEICKALKRNPKSEFIPILIITAKGEEVDRIVGFELGADDYVIKPFSPRELLLRIRAILRRYTVNSSNNIVVRHKNLTIDQESRRVLIEGEEIKLTATEFNLLLELLQNKERVRTRDQLLDHVWGYQFEGYARTVDTHIRRLRQKLGPYSECIETVRGVGYRFRDI